MTEDNKDVEISVEEAVKQMREEIEEITKASEAIQDEDLKAQADQLVAKAAKIFNNVADKIKETAKDISDSSALKELLDYVSMKAGNLYNSTLDKINELKENENVKKALNTAVETVKETGEKAIEAIKNNDEIMNVVNNVSEQAKDVYDNVIKNVDEFAKKKEVTDAVEKAKDVTIDLADKAIAVLREWLKPADKDGEE